MTRLEDMLEKIKFDPLQKEFEAFSEEQKQVLYDFDERYPEYLVGKGNGHPIRSLTRRENKPYNDGDREGLSNAINVTQFARKTRWSYQLLKIYDHYLEHDSVGVLFNQNYIANDPGVYNTFGGMGAAIIANLRRQEGFSNVQMVVDIVASVKSSIAQDYVAPGDF